MNETLINCSIIIPVFNNEGSLYELYEILKSVVIDFNNEIFIETIFVDDGSFDKSLDTLLSIKEKYNKENIKIIKLTRNFGQQNAIFAGLVQAKGSCFVNVSADQQEPLELINDMIKYHLKENYEIVIGIRSDRQESFYRKFTSNVFYKIMRKLAFPQMPKGGFDYMLYGSKTREYIINNFDSNSFYQGLLLWTGFKFKTIPYIRKTGNQVNLCGHSIKNSKV